MNKLENKLINIKKIYVLYLKSKFKDHMEYSESVFQKPKNEIVWRSWIHFYPSFFSSSLKFEDMQDSSITSTLYI